MIITIKKIGINGEGIGYDHKIPVFVEGALIDEIVNIKIIEDYKTYKKAKIIKIIKKSDERIIPKCKNYQKCGSCTLMHIDYQKQLEIKKELLNESLYKYASLNFNKDIIKCDRQLNYRNSFKMPFKMINNKLELGFYLQESHNFKSIDKCLIHEEILENIRIKTMEILNKDQLKAYDRKIKKGLRYLWGRILDNKVVLCFITGKDKVSQDIIEEIYHIDHIYTIYQSQNIKRNNEIFGDEIKLLIGQEQAFKIDNYDLYIAPKAFFQLNTMQAIKLYHLVKDMIKDCHIIFEAYAGIGLMSLMLNKKAKELYVSELNKDACISGNKNAKKNKINNITFISGKSENTLKKMFKNKIIDYLIIDPPRSGLSKEMIETIINTKIKNIIYISCNQATLAKNLKELKNYYQISDIKAIDLFPQTSKIETICALTKK